MWVIFFGLLVLFEGLADVLAKEWTIRDRAFWWLAAIAAYITANSFWLFALKRGAGLSRGAVLFSVSSALLAVAIGIFLYKEEPTKIQLAGVLVGAIAITLLAWE